MKIGTLCSREKDQGLQSPKLYASNRPIGGKSTFIDQPQLVKYVKNIILFLIYCKYLGIFEGLAFCVIHNNAIIKTNP